MGEQRLAALRTCQLRKSTNYFFTLFIFTISRVVFSYSTNERRQASLSLTLLSAALVAAAAGRRDSFQMLASSSFLPPSLLPSFPPSLLPPFLPSAWEHHRRINFQRESCRRYRVVRGTEKGERERERERERETNQIMPSAEWKRDSWPNGTQSVHSLANMSTQ